MQRYIAFTLALLALAACGDAAPPAGSTEAAPTTSAPVETPRPLEEVYPLSVPGPYQVGRWVFPALDASRAFREITITIWYPALTPDGEAGQITPDAPPDLSGAPYPLILSSRKVGDFFGAHLASYGFVAAGADPQDSSDRWDMWLIDYPLDIVFMLNRIAASLPEGLEGVIDANRAGAMGYSFDSYTSLALGGARIDPEFYLAQCAAAGEMDPAPPVWWITYICDLAGKWDAFTTYAANAAGGITASEDGLWQPITDERIRAVMPMAPEGAWLFGERGLAEVNRPALIISASADDINIYGLEAVPIFEQLGASDHAMITFVDRGHMMIYSPPETSRMRHFAVAFFGTYLQARDDYAAYWSEDFVAQIDNLAWGVCEGD
jgi:predicted dienelactone hydrolase